MDNLQRNKLAWTLFKYEQEVIDNTEIIQNTKREDLRTNCRNRNLLLAMKISELKNKLRKHLYG